MSSEEEKKQLNGPDSSNDTKKSSLFLEPFKLISSTFGFINFQSYWMIIISTFVVSASVVWSNFSRRPGTSFWDDLTNGMPDRGELGFGRFTIYGVTYPMEYPFRLYIRTLPSAVTPWLCYIPHQLGQFYILFKAKKAKESGEISWTDGKHWNPYAWAMLQWNIFFIVVHYLQTIYFYDGLAATFPEISTLFAGASSVIIAYVFEFKRRGFLFTWTPERWRENILELAKIFKHYHGYLASFGIVLTFWYHTMESTFAHWTGFTHIFLLLWQSSLLYQNAHRNRYWTFLLEMWIIVHATVVAYYQGILDGGLYAMFFTSFLLLCIMGPFWGLPVIKKFIEPKGQKSQTRVNILLCIVIPMYVTVLLYVYNSIGHFELLPMCLGLPGLYYFMIFWYYMFYASGKVLDKKMVDEWGIKRKGRVWWVVLSIWGAMSICSIMFLGEFIYRQFVPYSRPPKQPVHQFVNE